MKIVIAPQTFKGSISALDAAAAMRDGVLRVFPDAETVLVPVADGGDGTLETLVEGSGGEVRTATVTGPLGETRAGGVGRDGRRTDGGHRDGSDFGVGACAAGAQKSANLHYSRFGRRRSRRAG